MIVTFHEGSFKIQTSGIVLFTESLQGKTSNRHKMNVYIKTGSSDSLVDADYVIKGVGEYEVQGIQVRGFPLYTYVMRIEKMKVCFVSSSDITEKMLDSDVMEQLMNADVLFAPATPKSAQIIRQLQPRSIVVTSGNERVLEKELGATLEKTDKYTIKKKDLDQNALRLIMLTT